ncbi:membrane-associated PAP2 superfamily phosphatase [Albidovulum inexpectatum]|uniref:Membrane-associated PAP2 superfamily phosphatase n=1 Tax=Albidovulum inexpectatum TaxID=196587 RepID=A0A2S5JDN5_9RHOB|nr:phosphatase PAP2 family protein [Albidovulum inexpectatum]PPB79606.1 membrane-associated PAP2 superfamily phosphatase [Albidovulum inexpectatum]
MRQVNHVRLALWLAVVTTIAAAVFTLWPQIDLAVSRLFYRPGAGFWISDLPGVEALRHFVWYLSLGVVGFSLAALGLALAGRPIRGFGAREAAFLLTLYLLGPGLIVNVILKAHWGRARPAAIAEFGGSAHFTPALLPADQCARNCSFVSGEGSAAVALAIAFVVLVPLARRLLGRFFPLYVVAAMGLPAAGLVLRVLTGRHFLSDTVFAALIVLAIALVLHRVMLSRRP